MQGLLKPPNKRRRLFKGAELPPALMGFVAAQHFCNEKQTALSEGGYSPRLDGVCWREQISESSLLGVVNGIYIPRTDLQTVQRELRRQKVLRPEKFCFFLEAHMQINQEAAPGFPL